MTPEEEALVRARQQARSRVLAWILGGLVLLIFAITIVKIQAGLM